MPDASPPAESQGAPFAEGALDRMVGILGSRLFEFIVSSRVDSIADGSANPDAIAVAHEIDAFLNIHHEGESNPEAWGEVLKGNLTEASLDGGPLALRLRLQTGGVDELPEGSDEIERLLVGIAVRTYPAFLLPPDTQFPDPPGFPARPRVSGTMYRDKAAKDLFEEKVLEDPVFAKAYPHSSESTGPTGMIYCSSGRGGSIQLWMLAEQILQAAWAENPAANLTEFVAEALKPYRFTKAAFSGKEQMVKARMSFAGVLIPSGQVYSFGDVTLRAAEARDHENVPDSLSGQLGTTHENNEHILINYAGDVIAEADIPYVARVSKEKLSDPPGEFPQDILARNPLEGIATRLRTALLLAMKRSYRVQIVRSWQSANDPLNYGPTMSWATKESFVSLLAARLTEEDMAAWQDWYRLLSTPGAERIQLALSRVVRASAERRDHVDVLIDSVIAWENLFGTKDGEPTLRVTASLALLLEPDPAKRRKFRTKLGKMYGLRSDAVHGTALPKQADIPLCYEALDVAIKALRMVLNERADLLVEGDGGVRSLKLILGELAPEGKVAD